MLLVTVLEISYVFLAIGVACEIAQRSNDLFDEINDIFDQIDWYSYSNEIQRALPTVFNIAQQPVELEFFGSLAASRETFKKVGAPLNCY